MLFLDDSVDSSMNAYIRSEDAFSMAIPGAAYESALQRYLEGGVQLDNPNFAENFDQRSISADTLADQINDSARRFGLGTGASPTLPSGLDALQRANLNFAQFQADIAQPLTRLRVIDEISRRYIGGN